MQSKAMRTVLISSTYVCLAVELQTYQRGILLKQQQELAGNINSAVNVRMKKAIWIELAMTRV